MLTVYIVAFNVAKEIDTSYPFGTKCHGTLVCAEIFRYMKVILMQKYTDEM